MTTSNIDQVLNQMRILSQNHNLQGTQEASGAQFENVLKQSLDQVNEIQQEASELKTAFETCPDSNKKVSPQQNYTLIRMERCAPNGMPCSTEQDAR